MSTGDLFWIYTKYSEKSIESILSSFDPVEILLLEDEKELEFSSLPVQFLTKGLKNIKYCEELIKDFFKVSDMHSLGLEENVAAMCAVAMVLYYIQDTQLMEPAHIKKPKRRNLNSSMVLDRATIKNLELVASSYTGLVSGSLFSVIDGTSTQMGKRMLYSWVLNPLIDKKDIDGRLDIVELFFNNREALSKTKELLSNVNDISRIAGKIGLRRANGRELKGLQISLENISKLRTILLEIPEILKELDKYDSLLNEVIKKIDDCIVDAPPLTLLEGGIIKSSYNSEIKELRELSGDSKGWIKEFEEKEKKSTGISSLKIGFNKVFGYYIEVTKAHQEKVPERYIRKQTLVNSERYITEELKQKEDIILNAQERLNELEYELFTEFRDSLMKYIPELQSLSEYISEIDILSGFAKIAIERDYCKPVIYNMGEENGIIEIKSGRHPIVEILNEGEFISNDTYIDFDNHLISILTGPNMSGKSTYIRQVASLVLLAQIGCFVPAKGMKLSIVDRVFTRVGASDDLARGRSTFMVEMDEAANIVNSATKYSLVVLDEIGRGTSTYDGVSIAWALAEYLADDLKVRTLFATHYHELLKLAEKFPDKVKNYNVLVEEDLDEGTVIFLRKIVEGGTDRSYGIYVAKMAGLPEKVIKRANEILEGFEQEKMFSKEGNVGNHSIEMKEKEKIQSTYQLPLFLAKESEIEREIQSLNVDDLTPLEALNKINEWKKKI